MDSALDSTNPQNPHKKHKTDGCVVWWIGVGKVERTLLLAKAKSSKSFFNFYGIAESRVNFTISHFAWRILHFSLDSAIPQESNKDKKTKFALKTPTHLPESFSQSR